MKTLVMITASLALLASPALAEDDGHRARRRQVLDGVE